MGKSEDKFFEELSKRIMYIRQSKNLSQEELERLSGVDRVSIAYIEKSIGSPQLLQFSDFQKGLNIP